MPAPPTLQSEFPRYPADDLPTLPAGFEWSFWRNDACPLAYDLTRKLMISADFPDPADSDFGPDPEGYLRFLLAPTDEDGSPLHVPPTVHTNEWQDILEAVKRHPETS